MDARVKENLRKLQRLHRLMTPSARAVWTQEQWNAHIDDAVSQIKGLRVEGAATAPAPVVVEKPKRKRKGTEQNRMEEGGEDRSE